MISITISKNTFSQERI